MGCCVAVKFCIVWYWVLRYFNSLMFIFGHVCSSSYSLILYPFGTNPLILRTCFFALVGAMKVGVALASVARPYDVANTHEM